MKKITLIIILTITLLIITACSNEEKMQDDPSKITIYYFSEIGCFSCDAQDEFMNQLELKYEDIEIKKYNITNNKNEELLQKLTNAYQERTQSVPITFIGEEVFIGFGDAQTTGKLIEDAIKNCKQNTCKNPADILNEKK